MVYSGSPFSPVGSVDFVLRQRIREGASSKGAVQCPLGDKRKRALCLTRVGSQ